MRKEELKFIRYNRKSLQDFIDGPEFQNLKQIPISRQRALSLIHNPRSEEDDLILIVAWYRGKAIAFRTVLADRVYKGDNSIKVGWIAGTWVDPRYRNKGISKLLLNEVRKAWNDALMYTNYAPLSKKIYDKTGLFETYLSRRAVRFHFRFDLTHLLPARWPWMSVFSPILQLKDLFLNAIASLFIRFPDLEHQPWETVDPENQSVILDLFENTLTRRGIEEWNWVNNFPWILQKKDDHHSQKYHFSSLAHEFDRMIVQNKSRAASAMIHIRDGVMRVPYYQAKGNDLESLAVFLCALAGKRKVLRMDVYDESLNEALKRQRRSYLLARPLEWKYMVSKSVIHQFPSPGDVRLPDGEGELIFL